MFADKNAHYAYLYYLLGSFTGALFKKDEIVNIGISIYKSDDNKLDASEIIFQTGIPLQ